MAPGSHAPCDSAAAIEGLWIGQQPKIGLRGRPASLSKVPPVGFGVPIQPADQRRSKQRRERARLCPTPTRSGLTAERCEWSLGAVAASTLGDVPPPAWRSSFSSVEPAFPYGLTDATPDDHAEDHAYVHGDAPLLIANPDIADRHADDQTDGPAYTNANDHDPLATCPRLGPLRGQGFFAPVAHRPLRHVLGSALGADLGFHGSRLLLSIVPVNQKTETGSALIVTSLATHAGSQNCLRERKSRTRHRVWPVCGCSGPASFGPDLSC